MTCACFIRCAPVRALRTLVPSQTTPHDLSHNYAGPLRLQSGPRGNASKHELQRTIEARSRV